jgi:hypothetical protein
VGQLKGAPNGKRLALAAVAADGYPRGLLEVLDFDTRTGQLTPSRAAEQPGVRRVLWG